jgi:hypothetical protein
MTDQLWHHFTITDSSFGAGATVRSMLMHLQSVVPLRYIVLDDIIGHGVPGLILSFQEMEGETLSLGEEFFGSLTNAGFEWANFCLFKEAPKGFNCGRGISYPNLIKQTDTTVRVIDNNYLYVYTPYLEVADLIRKNYVIESYQYASLDKYVYPE